jgi:hypothetical protein
MNYGLAGSNLVDKFHIKVNFEENYTDEMKLINALKYFFH